MTVTYDVAGQEAEARVSIDLPLTLPATPRAPFRAVRFVAVSVDDPTYPFLFSGTADEYGLKTFAVKLRPIDEELGAKMFLEALASSHEPLEQVRALIKAAPDGATRQGLREYEAFLVAEEPLVTPKQLAALKRKAARAGDRGPDTARITQGDVRRRALVSELMVWCRIGWEFASRGEQGLREEEQLVQGASLDEALAAVRSLLIDPTGRREAGRRARGDDRRRLLERVAEEYRSVALKEKNPRKVVGDKLGYSAAHIGRLLVEARKTTPPLLGPAAPGKAGEIREPKL